MSLIDQQMKFLEDQRKAKAAEEAKKQGKPIETQKPAEAAGKNEDEEEKPKVEEVWFYTEGKGQMGQYTSFWHQPTGAAVEVWHDSNGGFTFTRAAGAQIKYCSSFCSMQDENALYAPELNAKLKAGNGTPLKSGVDGGDWGKIQLKGNKGILKSKVQSREGEGDEEINLTTEGFIFLSAGGLKCITVKKGELSIVSRQDALAELKAYDEHQKFLSAKS